MSLTLTIILAGAAGGAARAGITLAATWWFNRRPRRIERNRGALTQVEVDALKSMILGRPHA